jgi:hypothetical protein
MRAGFDPAATIPEKSAALLAADGSGKGKRRQCAHAISRGSGKPVAETNRLPSLTRTGKPSISMKIIILIFAWAGWAVCQPVTPEQKDSGWVSLFDGTTLKGFFTQFGSKIDTNPELHASAFSAKAADTSIAATGSPIGVLTTKKDYSHYRVRAWIKFGRTGNTGDNAGMLYHVQRNSPLLGGLYPRSVEFQGQKRGIGETWTIGNVWVNIKVKSATARPPQYSETGTEMSIGNAQGRQCLGSSVPYQDGQWNIMDLTVRGSDSATHTVNGTVVLRMRKMRWSEPDSPTDMSHPLANGGISFQSEGAPVAYTHLMIMELDPQTGKPIHAKPVPVGLPQPPITKGLSQSLTHGGPGLALDCTGRSWREAGARPHANPVRRHAAHGVFLFKPDSLQ